MASHLPLLLITLFLISVTATNAAILTGGIFGGILTCTNASVAMARIYNVIPDAKVNLFCGSGGTSLPALIQSTRTNTAGIYNFLIASLDTICSTEENVRENFIFSPVS
ncbi:hypothetical protein ACS0TY_036310 [Phlomoides rotata]